MHVAIETGSKAVNRSLARSPLGTVAASDAGGFALVAVLAVVAHQHALLHVVQPVHLLQYCARA